MKMEMALKEALEQADINFTEREEDGDTFFDLPDRRSIQVAGEQYYVYLVDGSCVETPSISEVISLVEDGFTS